MYRVFALCLYHVYNIGTCVCITCVIYIYIQYIHFTCMRECLYNTTCLSNRVPRSDVLIVLSATCSIYRLFFPSATSHNAAARTRKHTIGATKARNGTRRNNTVHTGLPTHAQNPRVATVVQTDGATHKFNLPATMTTCAPFGFCFWRLSV